ncbi:TonB-dependent receptor [uncultured Selenomonas sp.]|uniref:TonB-dependent receptor plug domain-containing protein n=1 Tax=uncultured Selenomonas sp. TaxID=159275 RepID=UPI0028DC8DA3|nr:TonB-dependent receptor [uncultured Selenomonas sp.]
MYKRIKKNKGKFLAVALSCMTLSVPQALAAESTGGGISEAEENVNAPVDLQEAASAKDYDLGGTVTLAERRKIKNPYTTGGDVDVITRRDIEKHNYSTIQDALKNIPGVRISTPGYRGGEYGYESFNTEFTINGEGSIVVLVDGSRIDNDASAFAGNKSRVNLSTLPGIDNVEQIEVIKGSGAAIYGADAAGGVISITTRRGTAKPRTTLNLSTGSWNHHRYALTHTGAEDDGTIKYALSVSREMSGDTKYKDVYTGKTESFNNTHYKSDNAAFNLRKDFDATHSLSLNYYYANERAHYPITAPDYRYMESFYNGTMASVNLADHHYIGLNSRIPGYRNIFLYDAWLGSHDETLTNNVSLRYVFDKTDEGAESFVRVFRNYTRYNMADYAGIWDVPYPYISEFWENAKANPGRHRDVEQSTGASVQLAKHIDQHSVTGGIDYRKSEYEGWNSRGRSDTSRTLWDLYLQDKMRLSDKFVLSPGLVYTHYGSGKYKKTNFSSAKGLTFSLYGSYDFDKQSNAYFSAAQIFKPVTGLDRSREFAGDILQDEKGWSYTLGASRRFTERDTAEINYGVTDMSNAIGRYSIHDGSGWTRYSVNAKRKKQALNLAYTHRFDKAWSLGVSYSWVNEAFSTKNVRRNPDGTNPDDFINAYRPRNIYRTHLMYDRDRWFADLSYTVYSGNDTRFFSDSHFDLIDLSVNYRVTADWQLYLNVYNILNTAYETRALAVYGPGALPEAGRSFMLGAKYAF